MRPGSVGSAGSWLMLRTHPERVLRWEPVLPGQVRRPPVEPERVDRPSPDEVTIGPFGSFVDCRPAVRSAVDAGGDVPAADPRVPHRVGPAGQGGQLDRGDRAAAPDRGCCGVDDAAGAGPGPPRQQPMASRSGCGSAPRCAATRPGRSCNGSPGHWPTRPRDRTECGEGAGQRPPGGQKPDRSARRDQGCVPQDSDNGAPKSEGRISTHQRGYRWDRTRNDQSQRARIWTGHQAPAHNPAKITARPPRNRKPENPANPATHPTASTSTPNPPSFSGASS